MRRTGQNIIQMSDRYPWAEVKRHAFFFTVDVDDVIIIIIFFHIITVCTSCKRFRKIERH